MAGDTYYSGKVVLVQDQQSASTGVSSILHYRFIDSSTLLATCLILSEVDAEAAGQKCKAST